MTTKISSRNFILSLFALFLSCTSLVMAQDEATEQPVAGITAAAAPKEPVKTILINFNNVNAAEFIRFISKISGKNFLFNEADLQFQITIVSEEPASLDNVIAALIQELRVHGLSLTEQGNNLLIHKNPNVRSISAVVADNLPAQSGKEATEIITRLFRLNTADAGNIAVILKPLLSSAAIIEVFHETNHLIVTDLAANINEVALLIRSLDAPNNGLVIGQYVVRGGFMDSLIQLAQRIMEPISREQTLIFVPHRGANSIFLVSTPFVMERTIALLQYLDQSQGATRIFDLKDLRFTPEGMPITPPGEGIPTARTPGVEGVPTARTPGVEGGAAGAGITRSPPGPQGRWEIGPNGQWVFRPPQAAGIPPGGQVPQGYWHIDDQGNWRFQLGATPPGIPRGPAGVAGPEGEWKLDAQGIWVFQLSPGKSISPERLIRPIRGTADLPAGHIDRVQFHIYKLQYRKGDQIVNALGRIGLALRQTTTTNIDLVSTIDSVQWIESSNSLIFTGIVETLDKVIDLIQEIDTPLRQVFVEMLILDTTLDDSLNYGVDWGTRFGGGNTSGSQAFLSAGSALPVGLSTAGTAVGAVAGTVIDSVPSASSLALNTGYSLGIIGQHLTFCGMRFNTIGALVRAVHSRSNTDVVLTPKLLVEDNSTAEIFVGLNTQFPTQAISNDQGSIITQNFEYRDVGTRMRITPQIGDNDMITITVEEEVSSIAGGLTAVLPGSGPTTRKSTTVTKFHLPNEFFLVMSGMMQDEDIYTRNQVPCLGGIPFIGGGFSNMLNRESKRNLMIFLRPRIIETDEEIDNITKHQQDIFKYERHQLPMWQVEEKDALDFFNLPDCESCPDCCIYKG